jgi:two-component system, chemotaxis family, CheB/CheR fusion protein
LLLKETHHRIKNNMGTINSLLSLQANDQIDPAAKTVLDDAAQRLQSMMVLYDKLYRSENYGELSVKEYLPALIAEIVGAFPIAVPVVTDIQVDDFTLSAKILSNIGIIMNELVANSMKYAFGSTERGLIHISAAVDGSKVRFVYADDGAGLPHTVDFEHSTGFGLQLVQLLVRQIGGTIRIDREEGTRYVIELER